MPEASNSTGWIPQVEGLTVHREVCLGQPHIKDVLRRGTPPLPLLLSLCGGFVEELDNGVYTDKDGIMIMIVNGEPHLAAPCQLPWEVTHQS